MAPHVIPGASTTHPDPHATLYHKTSIPLTPSQKLTMRADLLKAGYEDSDIAAYEHDQGGTDKGLTALYELVAEGGIYNSNLAHKGVKQSHVPTIPGISSIVDFLKLLTSAQLWVRIAELLIGFALIGVGVAKLSTGAASSLSKIPGYGKVIS